MPTKWKRYRCNECQNILVAWKLRKNNGKRYCQKCIDNLYQFTLKFYQKPPNKKEILEKYQVVNIEKKYTNYNQTGK